MILHTKKRIIMKKFSSCVVMLSLFLSYSCSSLNSAQDRELKEWQAKNLEVKDKQPTTAAVLNVLPGIGDFYNGNVGLGVANLLAWPLSVLWAPVGGASGANEVNYYSTKANVDKLEAKRKKLKSDVEISFIGNQISKQEYIVANKKIDAMELNEFNKTIEVTDIIPKSMETLEAERIPSSTKK